MAVDFEKQGVFYLGRKLDGKTLAPKEDLLLYDAKDLTTHARHRRHDRQRQDGPRHRAARGGRASTASPRS